MNSKKKNKRWRLLADGRLQGQLCFRVAFYWILCQLTLIGTIATFNFLTNGEGSAIGFCVAALIVSSLFLPIALYDTLSFSNRFVGPMVNLRGKLKKYFETGSLERIQLRKGDFYTDVFDAINELGKRKEIAHVADVNEELIGTP